MDQEKRDKLQELRFSQRTNAAVMRHSFALSFISLGEACVTPGNWRIAPVVTGLVLSMLGANFTANLIEDVLAAEPFEAELANEKAVVEDLTTHSERPQLLPTESPMQLPGGLNQAS